MNKNEERNIVKIATLYYKEGLTQAEIAKKIGVSRSLVSKMLIDARNAGFIEIFINSEEVYSLSLETELEKKFNLENAVIIDTRKLTDSEIAKVVSQAAAIFLKKKIFESTTIGISWGESLRDFVNQFPFENHPDLTFIPLIGGMGVDFVDVHSNQLCYDMARKTRGKAKYLYAPALIESTEIKEELEKNKAIKSVIEEGKKVDLAIVGISSPYHDSTMKKIGYLTKEDIQELKNLNVLGDINSRFYDSAGVEVDFRINHNVIGLSLEDLKKINHVAAIAYAPSKWTGIKAACENNLLDTLITTDIIAEKILAD